MQNGGNGVGGDGDPSNPPLPNGGGAMDLSAMMPNGGGGGDMASQLAMMQKMLLAQQEQVRTPRSR